jgi:hypothetical protein
MANAWTDRPTPPNSSYQNLSLFLDALQNFGQAAQMGMKSFQQAGVNREANKMMNTLTPPKADLVSTPGNEGTAPWKGGEASLENMIKARRMQEDPLEAAIKQQRLNLLRKQVSGYGQPTARDIYNRETRIGAGAAKADMAGKRLDLQKQNSARRAIKMATDTFTKSFGFTPSQFNAAKKLWKQNEDGTWSNDAVPDVKLSEDEITAINNQFKRIQDTAKSAGLDPFTFAPFDNPVVDPLRDSATGQLPAPGGMPPDIQADLENIVPDPRLQPQMTGP